MSSPNHPTSNMEDAFSSNFPNHLSASPDYIPTSPGKTYSSSSNSLGIPSSIPKPQESFLPEEFLSPKKRGRSSSSSLPQAFEIGESSRKTSMERHEEQIKEILNHLGELSLDPELQQARAQITKLQRKQMGSNYKTSLARFRINDMNARHQADIENLQDSIIELKNRMK
ncbi:hypothetical protein Tco_0214664 [Tanacetum coccineum]